MGNGNGISGLNGWWKWVLGVGLAIGGIIAGLFGGWATRPSQQVQSMTAVEHRLRLESIQKEQEKTNALLQGILDELRSGGRGAK